MENEESGSVSSTSISLYLTIRVVLKLPLNFVVSSGFDIRMRNQIYLDTKVDLDRFDRECT